MPLDKIQIVDKIDASPTVRLDLNDGSTWFTQRKADLSPPPLRRAVIRSLLTDGSPIPASAYDNRIVRLRLYVTATDMDDLGTQLEKLDRELDRAVNVIKYQRDGATNPVFFRTLRSPDYKLNIEAPAAKAFLDVPILAEPFAYGLRIDSGAIVVENDPADAGAQPSYFDVTGVLGDVPTPGVFRIDGTTLPASPRVQFGFTLASRRHGTPANVTLFRQAEAFTTQSTDTATTTANDATASGVSPKSSRTTFSSIPGMTLRLIQTGAGLLGGTIGPDLRGTYRVYARVKKTVTGDVINVRMRYGTQSLLFTGDTVALPNSVGDSGVGWQLLDLGLMRVPAIDDPVTDGYSNVEYKVETNPLFTLDAERVSGSGNLDWDYVFFVPADEEFALVHWWTPNASGGVWAVIDGPRDKLYAVDATNNDQLDMNSTVISRVGAIPLLTPNQTNRIVLISARIDSPGLDKVPVDHIIADSLTIRHSYWPRWLYVRP